MKIDLNDKNLRILCYWGRYGLLSDGTFFYYCDWQFYYQKLNRMGLFELNKFFRRCKRFDNCIYIDPNNEINERNFAKFLAICLARKCQIKLFNFVEEV